MSNATSLTPSSPHHSPFEAIRRTNAAGNEFWSSRDLARVLGYSDYRNFEQVVQKARMACFNSAPSRDSTKTHSPPHSSAESPQSASDAVTMA